MQSFSSLKSSFCKDPSSSSSVDKNLPLIRETLLKAMDEIKKQSSACRALSFIKRISLDLDFEKMQRMLQDLQKGYLVSKHSPNTLQPHDKYIYISSDRRFLCWKSLEKDDEKTIELRKIQNIIKSEIQFRTNCRTIRNFDLVLIINSQVRSLEIEFKSVQEKMKFYQQLLMAIKNSRRMNLSYKF